MSTYRIQSWDIYSPYYILPSNWHNMPMYEDPAFDDPSGVYPVIPEADRIYTAQPMEGYAREGTDILRVYETTKYGSRVDLYNSEYVRVNGVWIYNVFLKEVADSGGDSGGGSGDVPIIPEYPSEDDVEIPEEGIDTGAIYVSKGSYEFSGNAETYQRGVTNVYVYDREGLADKWSGSGLCGALKATTCIRNAELNGDDTVELTHPYDDGGKWRYLTPGRILKVFVLTQIPKKSAKTLGMIEELGSANIDGIQYHTTGPGDVIEFAPDYILAEGLKESEVHERYAAELAQVTGSVRKNRPFRQVYSYDAGDYWGYEWDAYLAKFVDNQGYEKTGYIDSQYVQKITTTYNTTALQLPYAFRAQQYTIISVDYDMNGLTVTARTRSIDDCQYLYNARAQAADNIHPQAVDQIIYRTILGIKDSGQSMGDIRVHCYPYDNAITGFKTASGTLHDILIGLRDTFNYDILRDNGDIYLYNHLGSDRGVTLEVGRNLTALGITLENTNADMDGVLTYYTDDDNRTHASLYKVRTPNAGIASRTRAVSDERASTHYESMGVGAANAVLSADAKLYAEQRLKGHGDYVLTLTPEVYQTDRGGNVPIELREPLLIGDTVTVKDPRLEGGSTKVRIVSKSEDCLTGRVLGITVGDLPENLYGAMLQLLGKR